MTTRDLILRLSPEAARELADLCERAEASPADVIRQALSLLWTAKEAKDRGEILMFVSTRGPLSARVVKL